MTVTAVLVVLFGLMQLVPYGRAHTNPPVRQEPPWDSPATRELAERACFDCHSQRTKWPWYSDLAPFSWVVQKNVDNGRTVLNFSDWSGAYPLARQASQSVLAREMPPRTYLLAHPEANLTDAERERLAKGLHLTFGLAWRD